MTSKNIRTCVLLSLLTGLSGCSAPDESVTVVDDVGTLRAPFSTSPDEPNHEEITATALSFLQPAVLTALQAANVATDVEFFLVNANHFDDCNFTGGSEVVSNSQAEAVGQLDPESATPEADLLAIRAFARSIHALQDFYAHTNWVESGGEVLVDESLGAFPRLSPYSTLESSGFVVVQGRKPKHAALNRRDEQPYPSNALVRVKLGKTRAAGLISGSVDYEEGDFCPPAVAMTHAELNKDKSSLTERAEQYEAAKALAILQTEHEWCRLRSLTSAQWGEAGVARLDSWVADGATTPACQ